MDLEVDRGDLHRVRNRDHPPAELADGEARLVVETFALSANNITYGVLGDALRYWDAFPVAPEPSDPSDATSWGHIPVWGFGRVTESRSDDLAVGRRVYGYLPMASELTVTPGRFDERGFSDVAPHRAEMAGAYGRYMYVDTDPLHRDDREPHRMLLYPLFFTSFVIDDLLVDNDDFGASHLWISSASAKTAIGVAFLVRQRPSLSVVGLTSERNRAFVEGLDVYDKVLTYDEVASGPLGPAVYVDVAGNADVTRQVHAYLGDELAYSMAVGGTHWDHEVESADPLPGPSPAFFFAPTQIAKRIKEWGRGELEARTGAAWDAYTDWVDGWIDFRHQSGAAAIEAAYHELLDNVSDPRTGHICKPSPDPGVTDAPTDRSTS